VVCSGKIGGFLPGGQTLFGKSSRLDGIDQVGFFFFSEIFTRRSAAVMGD
jgi:hypothetical protein